MQKGLESCARGYTAVELLIVMAVLGLLAAIALPNFNGLIERQRMQTRIHLLTAHLALARSMAIMRRTAVSVCPSADGTMCRTDSNWSAGWILFADPSNQGQPSSALSILRVERHPTKQRLSITSTAGRPLIRFMPDGRSGGSNATISLCIRAAQVADVVINNSGRARSVRYASARSCPAPTGT
ncbi:prepilin-type cleavage/methylation domain-containing protein [Xanthomonas arboricola pv. populi]|uniref:Type II secretion system protein H n=1 Tax=Xanthomonas arboricola pv. populi TaxID=487823 RepID=A0A2S6Z0A8_9XANT|nr:Tfp pilus assembly protein FimT/FimU [Xanthomonas arboricola]PPT73838.1 prepilin-type cleavage/methylation domain-containing protein [Xanthomonas arboricola pv. populi]